MEKYVEFQRKGMTLRGMLHLPDNYTGKPPIAVLLHGFGGDRNAANYALTSLSRSLAKSGIASVRFDFLCNGESDGEFVDMTISGEIEDACSILEYVASLDEVDASRIALFGLSMGGAVAAVAASRKKELVKALCLCCPASNASEDARNKKVKGVDISDILEKGYCDIGGIAIGKAFYEDAIGVDFYELARGFNGNVFIVHGDKDVIAPLENSKKYLKLYGEKARLFAVEGGDHSFTNLPANKKRIQLIVDYLTEVL